MLVGKHGPTGQGAKSQGWHLPNASTHPLCWSHAWHTRDPVFEILSYKYLMCNSSVLKYDKIYIPL